MQEVKFQDQRIPARPALPLGSRRAPSDIGLSFWRVPAPEAKNLNFVNSIWECLLIVNLSKRSKKIDKYERHLDLRH